MGRPSKTYLPFAQAREFVRALGLRTNAEYFKWLKGELQLLPRPDYIPSAPNRVYRHKGWIDWRDWLGAPRLPSGAAKRSDTWTREEVERLLVDQNKRVLEAIPLFVPHDLKLRIECMRCGNRRNRLNDGDWLFSVHQRKRNQCPKCTQSQRPTMKDLLSLAIQAQVEIVSPIPSDYGADTFVEVRCARPSCLNTLAKDGESPWRVILEQIYQNRAGCPRCSGRQRITKIRLTALLADKNLSLVNKKGPLARSAMTVRCETCRESFPTTWDRLSRENTRRCRCEKNVWYHFQLLVCEVYGGGPAMVNGVEADCVPTAEIVIDAKFGDYALRERGKGRKYLEYQAHAYLESGRIVYYVVNAPRHRVPRELLIEGIIYIFQEDLQTMAINGRCFSDEQKVRALRMYSHPWEFSTKVEPADYAELRAAYAAIVEKNNFYCPSSEVAEIALGVSYQKIRDAFRIPDRAPNAAKMIAERVSKILGRAVRLHSDDSKMKSYERLALLVKATHNGKLLTGFSDFGPRVALRFSCRQEKHPSFPLRADKVYDGRWCPNCRLERNVSGA